MWRRGDVRSVTPRLLWLVLVAAVVVVVLWLRPVNLRGPVPPTEIYRGVWYTCDRLAAGAEGSGLYHLVMVDLSAPGIELYVTPLDDEAVKESAQYRLAVASGVALREDLAVLINGTLFDTDGKPPLPGTLARSNETLVANGEVSHIHAHSYLLWFDEELTPHMEFVKPPPQEALRKAKWGISGQGVSKLRNIAAAAPDSEVNSRTVLGVNPRTRKLWMAVFSHASNRIAMETLKKAGATEAISLDNGHSTTMVLGGRSFGVDGGVVLGGRRPSATYFGVRATPIAER